MKRLILSDWAAIAEISGTVAVVVSLAFVVHSINLNTKAMQANTDNFIYGLQDSNLALTAGNSGFAPILLKALENETLSPIEQLKLDTQLSRVVNLWELAFSRHQEGLMAEHTWETWNKSATDTFLRFMDREMWEENKGIANDDFAAHVDEILMRN